MKYRVLTYNIHKGFDTLGTKFTLHQIKEALRETGADLCLLQEVVGEDHDQKKNQKDWPIEAQFEFLADSVWPHFSYGKNAIFSSRHHGNAVLSKYPVLKEENISLTLNKWEQRGLLHCEIDIPHLKTPLHVFNTHLNLRETDRMEQMARLIARAKKSVPKEASFIIGGDFNDWNKSLDGQVTEFLGMYDCHAHHHKSLGKSFPSLWPQLSLDRLYFRELKLSHAEVLKGPRWSRLSDHLPLYAEFDFK